MVILGHLWQLVAAGYLAYATAGLWVTRDRDGAA